MPVATGQRSSYHFADDPGEPPSGAADYCGYPACRCICHMRPKPDPSDAWSRLGEAEQRLLFGPGPWPVRSKEILCGHQKFKTADLEHQLPPLLPDNPGGPPTRARDYFG